MKNFFAFILAFIIIAGAAACSGGDEGNPAGTADDSTAQETTDGTVRTNLPADLNYDGRTFSLLSSDYNQYHFTTVEEMNGDVLNDAIYNMEFAVEGQLNIEIEEDSMEVNSLNRSFAGF